MSDDTWVRDQLEIRSLIEAYGDCVTRRVPDEIMELWADDCRWSVPDMEGLEDVRGKDAIRANFEAAQGLFNVTFLVCNPGNIAIDGDKATIENIELEGAFGVLTIGFELEKRDGKWIVTYQSQY